MTMGGPSHVSVAVEGMVDEAVLRCLAADAGAAVGCVYSRGGKATIRQRINGFNQAAHISPWVVLVDLEDDADCAPPLCTAWLPQPAPVLMT